MAKDEPAGEPISALSGGLSPTRNRELQRVLDHAAQVATTPYAVLIEGETGTGKERFARAIHAASRRAGPFVPLNCGALPESLFEVELFGARRGAYTGLDIERSGLFVLADRGTLFLDEIADMPLPMQAKLLRVLEDGVIRPLGGTASSVVHVRVLAATNQPLAPLVEQGAFRRDLYFRLSAASLRLPPLRERREDIPVLVGEAIAEACGVQRKPPGGIDPAAMSLLVDYPWPGNIRELNHAVAAGVLSSKAATIHITDLPAAIRARLRDPGTAELPAFFEALAAFERDYLAELLRRASGNLTHASQAARLSRAAIRDKARRYGLLGSTRRARDGPCGHCVQLPGTLR